MPTLAGAQNAAISKSILNDVAQNQYNFHLNQSPSPLVPLFSVANVISSMVPEVKASKEQIKALATSIDTLLKMLDTEYQSGRLLETQSSVSLESLQRHVNIAIQLKCHSSQLGQITEGDLSVCSKTND